jgi:hypothetical protein
VRAALLEERLQCGRHGSQQLCGQRAGEPEIGGDGPGTYTVKLPKNASPMKNTTVAVRLTTSSRTSRPPRAKYFLRLSPVPVLAPTTIGAWAVPTNAPCIRWAVPASTMSISA